MPRLLQGSTPPHGGGNHERKLLSPRGVYRKLDKAPDLLPGYRVLCHNCNSAMAYYGHCPHQGGPPGSEVV